MKINIIAVGKIKEKYITDGIAEYAKRISRFADFSVVEVPEYPPASAGGGAIQKSLEAEEKGILNASKGCVVALAINGRQFSSPELADFIDAKAVSGVSQISFVIGGSDGLSDGVLKRADLQISFGKATYPHQLMRLILSEQIYRAFSILNNLPYHK